MQRHSVVLALVATLAVHLLSVTRRLAEDEGGFAMVARHWREGGGFLYGPQWVDRPPGLITLLAAAERLGPYDVRLAATLLALTLVAALAWAADAVGGRLAARWAAWAGFAFASSVLLQAQRLNGELAAATFVTLSVGALLGASAGAAATVAVLMKQNFVDAFVFAGVLVSIGAATRHNRLTYRPGQVLLTVAGYVAGALVGRLDRRLGARARWRGLLALRPHRVPCRRLLGDRARVAQSTAAPVRHVHAAGGAARVAVAGCAPRVQPPTSPEAPGPTATARRAHYRAVADVCGHQVWLHDGIHRQLAPQPPASACGPGEQ